MKKIKLIVFSILLFILGFNVKAASLSMSTSKTTVTVGSTFKITVKASGGAGWEYYLNYDNTLFELTNSTADTGGKCVLTGSTLIGYSNVSFTLKAKKSGIGTFSLNSAAMYDDNGANINFTKGSVKVTNRTQAEIEASYSKNAYLKSLNVKDYTITPTFKKDIYEYNLEVENDVEKVVIEGTKEDSRSTINGLGSVNLTEGLNTIKVKVTAQKGNELTYTLLITRKELNPLIVTIDDKEYSIVRKKVEIDAPTYYTSTTIPLNIDNEEVEVPGYTSEITGYNLVMLKDENGNINFYRYEDNKFILNKQVSLKNIVFVEKEPLNYIDSYTNQKNITIGDTIFNGYTNNKDNMILIYGTNMVTGNTTWYRYDQEEETLQRYSFNVESDFDSTKEIANFADFSIEKKIIFVISLLLIITLITIIFLMLSNFSIRRKNKKIYHLLEKLQKDKTSSKKDENKEDDKTSRKELKKQAKQEKEEAKEMREEFLSDYPNFDMISDVDTREVTFVKQGKKKTMKKAKKQK